MDGGMSKGEKVGEVEMHVQALGTEDGRLGTEAQRRSRSRHVCVRGGRRRCVQDFLERRKWRARLWLARRCGRDRRMRAGVTNNSEAWADGSYGKGGGGLVTPYFKRVTSFALLSSDWPSAHLPHPRRIRVMRSAL